MLIRKLEGILKKTGNCKFLADKIPKGRASKAARTDPTVAILKVTHKARRIACKKVVSTSFLFSDLKTVPSSLLYSNFSGPYHTSKKLGRFISSAVFKILLIGFLPNCRSPLLPRLKRQMTTIKVCSRRIVNVLKLKLLSNVIFLE